MYKPNRSRKAAPPVRQRLVNDGNAPAELVVQRLSSRIEEREHEAGQAKRRRDERDNGARERRERSWREAVKGAQTLSGERHSRSPTPQSHEDPGPGERQDGAGAEPQRGRDEDRLGQ
jgi:hypothetical protein